MAHLMRVSVLTLAVLGLAACAMTRFKSTWQEPSASPITLSGQKVAAFVLAASETTRRAAEDALAQELSARGAQGVASYTLLPSLEPRDPEATRQKLEQAGVEGAVTMRVVGRDTRTTYTPPTFVGYYRVASIDAGSVRTDTLVSVETRVYSVAQDKLLWAGESVTTNPTKLDTFIKELSAKAAEEMQKAGLLRK
jgi:hypothetical protein